VLAGHFLHDEAELTASRWLVSLVGGCSAAPNRRRSVSAGSSHFNHRHAPAQTVPEQFHSAPRSTALSKQSSSLCRFGSIGGDSVPRLGRRERIPGCLVRESPCGPRLAASIWRHLSSNLYDKMYAFSFSFRMWSFISIENDMTLGLCKD
jgi:hypothetical protein